MSIGKVRYIVDHDTIVSGDIWQVVEPMIVSVDICRGVEEYEKSLQPFSTGQRLLHAICQYWQETNMSGHKTFFTNSHGMVWEDAKIALQTIGASEVLRVLTEACDRLGGNPSKDRTARTAQVTKANVSLDDLDKDFFEVQRELESKILSYINTNELAFYFDGYLFQAV